MLLEVLYTDHSSHKGIERHLSNLDKTDRKLSAPESLPIASHGLRTYNYQIPIVWPSHRPVPEDEFKRLTDARDKLERIAVQRPLSLVNRLLLMMFTALLSDILAHPLSSFHIALILILSPTLVVSHVIELRGSIR